MEMIPMIKCTRITIGEINQEDRVFSARIIAECVAEKLNIPEDQVLGKVFRYVRNLVVSHFLEIQKITSALEYDTPLWIAHGKLPLFVPSL